MKNITLRAPEQKIESARRHARQRRTTLNRMFLEWLDQMEGGDIQADRLDAMYVKLEGKCTAGRSFSREEMNER